MNLYPHRILFFLLAITASLFSKLQAQVALGGELGYNRGFKGFSNMSVGFRADLLQDDDHGVLIGLNYFLPYRSTSTVALTPDNPFDPVQTVPSSIRISGIHFHSEYKNYLFGEYDEGVALYLVYGVGVNVFFYRETIEGTYTSNYNAPEEFRSNVLRSTGFGVSGNVLLGVDLPLTDQHVFHSEAGYSYSQQIPTEGHFFSIPSSLVFRAGYRFEFD